MNELGWGLQISALGMGLVFALLALLWGLLTLVLQFDRPPEAAGLAGATLAAEPVTEHEADLDPALVAAITVAVTVHAAARRGEAPPERRVHVPGSLLHASRWLAAGRARQNRNWRRGRGGF
jgi:Na+-transporting methylmalonyl-CoA/oxaloacetate decarboxylase gamma subunit